MKYLLVIIISLLSFSIFGQNGSSNSSGARSNAIGNASINFSDINSLFNNQAGLADLPTTSFIVAAERRFALADLNNLSAGFAIPTGSGTFGVSLNYFGFEKYNETKVGLAYGRKLIDKLAIGLQFDVLNTRIPQYGSKNLFTFEVGLQSEMSETLTLGFHVFNPVKLETIEDEFLPTILRAGATYSPSEKVFVHTEIEKDIDFPFTVKLGIEYELLENFWLRFGASTAPTSASFGIGYLLKNGIRLDLASNYHQELGFTPTVSLGFDLKKNK